MSRLIWLALVLCWAAAALAQTPPRELSPASQESFLPVSVWYGGGKARAPMLEPITPDSRRIWRADLEKIKSLGFNTVRTWVEWTAGEPAEGQYQLEQLDLMLALAREVGLKAIVQVYVDSAPDWVGRKFPDSHFVAQNGQAIPSQSAPGFCFDHPGVRKAVLAFFQEVARHAERSPVFFGWDLWSEPHVINWAEITYIPHASFCYCPSDEPAHVAYSGIDAKQPRVRELVAGGGVSRPGTSEASLTIQFDIPPQGVRVYRLDYR